MQFGFMKGTGTEGLRLVQDSVYSYCYLMQMDVGSANKDESEGWRSTRRR